MLTSVDGNGHSTSYAYDGLRRLTTTTDALGGVSTVSYDTNGLRYTYTDPLGHTTTTTYDGMGRLTTTTRDIDTQRGALAAHRAYLLLDDAFREFVAERGANRASTARIRARTMRSQVEPWLATFVCLSRHCVVRHRSGTLRHAGGRISSLQIRGKFKHRTSACWPCTHSAASTQASVVHFNMD